VHEQGQGPGFASDASIRGFSSDHSTDLALWIDGVPINETVNGHAEGNADWSLIFSQAVSDIDVVKGPTSALFGNFAMAGVVTVRTLERVRDTEVVAGGGSNGRADVSLMTGFDKGATGGGVFGARFQREDGWRPHAAFDLAQAHARLVREVSPGTAIDAGVELYGARWDSPGFLTEEQFADRDYGVVVDQTDGGFKRRAQERVSVRVLRGRSLWRSTAYATQGRWQLFLNTPPEGDAEEGSGGQTEEEDTRFGAGLTSALTVAFANAEVTVGGEGRFDRARYENWLTEARTRGDAQELDRSRQLSGGSLRSVDRNGRESLASDGRRARRRDPDSHRTRRG